jgi:drug/metabolite transporter (DMT)-like permease
VLFLDEQLTWRLLIGAVIVVVAVAAVVRQEQVKRQVPEEVY